MDTFARLPALNFELLDRCGNFVLLESNRLEDGNCFSYLFTDPVEILQIVEYESVPEFFEKVEKLSEKFYLAGFLTYELGNYFNTESRLARLNAPLAWLGVFDDVCVFDHRRNTFNVDYPAFQAGAPEESYKVDDLKLEIECDAYLALIDKIKAAIEAGDTYQVNLTTRYDFKFAGSPYGLYTDLKSKQSVSYNAFIKSGDEYILSVSPELFFRRDGKHLTVRPMKGTMARGRFAEEDRRNAKALQLDPKNRSENVMIVDLMRNDLGRISEVGSVRVSKQFEIEKYESLFQMTSTIESDVRDETDYFGFFKALFPCGSVTGAPKVSTMKIIEALEPGPRGVYTGAIGFLAPGKKAVFNVPIRTVRIKGEQGEMGVGSGIVYDSDAVSEFEECRLKARFLLEDVQSFSLIESILWRNNYMCLPLHLARLADSACYFDFVFDRAKIIVNLQRAEAKLRKGARYKVRLLLNKAGISRISAQPLADDDESLDTVAISSKRTDSRDPFLFHKTTNRKLYNSEFEKFRGSGFADVLFFNERDELTEGAISNVFIEQSGMLLTPPVACGLLNGVARQSLLHESKAAAEKVIGRDDLLGADRILLTNAIRGTREVELGTSFMGTSGE